MGLLVGSLLVDRKPENRIAMQYIKLIPEDFDPVKSAVSDLMTSEKERYNEKI